MFEHFPTLAEIVGDSVDYWQSSLVFEFGILAILQ